MKLFAFSDWRVQDIELAIRMAKGVQPDVILYAGDDVDRFVSQSPSLNYFEELAELSGRGLGAIIGNDCAPSDRELISGHRVREIHNSPWQVGEWKIIGLEGGTRESERPMGQVLYTGEELELFSVS